MADGPVVPHEVIDRALVLDEVVAGYNGDAVLRSVSLAVSNGEIGALVGHNGAGKSTLLKVAFGILPVTSGRAFCNGVPITGLKPDRLLRLGVMYIPQGNRVFGSLTVQENLQIGAHSLERQVIGDGIERACELFPFLRARMKSSAGHLSGGERQMLALANAVVLRPRLLLLDEPSLGLSPNQATVVFEKIQEMNRSSHTAVLVVEQKVRAVLAIAHRAFVLRNGKMTFEGLASSLADDERFRAAYL